MSDTRHIGFNPNPLYGDLSGLCERQAADGFALVRVVPVDPYRSVAVFARDMEPE